MYVYEINVEHQRDLFLLSVDQYMQRAKTLPTLPLPPYSSDYQDRALLELQKSNHDPERALASLSKLTTEDFEYIVDWTKDEVKSFEEGVTLHGHDLYQVGRMVPSKRHADVVRFFFQWKKTDRYEPVYSQWTKVYKPAKRFKKSDVAKSISPAAAGEASHPENDKSHYHQDSESDAESGVEESDPTVIRVSSEAMKDFTCANCGTAESRIWRRMPTDIDLKRKVFRQVLCNDCGEIWLKYSIMPKTTNEGQRGRFKSPKAGGMKRKRFVEVGTSKSRRVGDKDVRLTMMIIHAWYSSLFHADSQYGIVIHAIPLCCLQPDGSRYQVIDMLWLWNVST